MITTNLGGGIRQLQFHSGNVNTQGVFSGSNRQGGNKSTVLEFLGEMETSQSFIMSLPIGYIPEPKVPSSIPILLSLIGWDMSKLAWLPIGSSDSVLRNCS